MKLFLATIGFLMLWCFVFRAAAQDEEDLTLKKKISLHLKDQSLENVLDEISRQADIDFSYDPSILDSDRMVSVAYDQEETGRILEDLLGSNYRIRLLNRQVIITLTEKKDQVLNEWPDTPSPDILKISGTVRDAETNEAIPYASISVRDEPFGTITNRDGLYEIKLPAQFQKKELVCSCMGYAQKMFAPDTTLAREKADVTLQPVRIRLGEIKVTAADPLKILSRFLDHIPDNYPEESRLMTSFYREVLLQDKTYVNVSEAVIHILKAPYGSNSREDRIRFLKGRKSPDVKAFKGVDFKMQGGPYYMNKLDVVKTMDTFLDREYRSFYKYELGYMIDYFGRPAYVILFRPAGKIDFPCYEGKLYIDQETFALVHAEFNLGRDGMKFARKSLIRKKPKGFNVRPLDLDYSVSYKRNDGRWYLKSAQTSLRFRVKSRHDKINSVFHSISDLLVTNYEKTDLKRFQKEETFSSTDIFTEMIIDYDKEFWGNFNVIQPNEDLRKALSKPDTADITIKKSNDEEVKPDHVLTQHAF